MTRPDCPRCSAPDVARLIYLRQRPGEGAVWNCPYCDWHWAPEPPPACDCGWCAACVERGLQRVGQLAAAAGMTFAIDELVKDRKP